MQARLPHPVPYQGSKRTLAPRIGVHAPRDIDVWFEPFAGSAAMTLWALEAQVARRYVIADVLAPIAGLWRLIIDAPAATQRGMAVLNAAPYGSGMLAKGTAAYPRYAYQQASDAFIARTRQYEEICDRYGVPLAAVSLQFSTRDPRITSTIVGMSKPQRIGETIDLLMVDIPAACWEEILAIPFDADDPEKDRWK